MERSARIYNCARCNAQVIICSSCDKNNIYCCNACSSAARAQSCKAATARYAETRQGRHQHAKRQKQYRERQKNKVTHHTSTDPLPHDELQTRSNGEKINPACGEIRCHFCRKRCSPFLRLNFLPQKKPQRQRKSPIVSLRL